MKQLVVARGAEFYDFSNYDPLYKKPKYFKDQLHLNVNGVEVFSREITYIIKH